MKGKGVHSLIAGLAALRREQAMAKPHIRYTISRRTYWSRTVRDFVVTMPDGHQLLVTTDGWKILAQVIAAYKQGDGILGQTFLGYA